MDSVLSPTLREALVSDDLTAYRQLVARIANREIIEPATVKVCLARVSRSVPQLEKDVQALKRRAESASWLEGLPSERAALETAKADLKRHQDRVAELRREFEKQSAASMGEINRLSQVVASRESNIRHADERGRRGDLQRTCDDSIVAAWIAAGHRRAGAEHGFKAAEKAVRELRQAVAGASLEDQAAAEAKLAAAEGKLQAAKATYEAAQAEEDRLAAAYADPINFKLS